MEQMLAHLTAASAQAAAASLVSGLDHTGSGHFNAFVHSGVGTGSVPTHSPSPPHSPPVKRTSAQSAMPTPSPLCSSLVATSPASKWAPWTWGGN